MPTAIPRGATRAGFIEQLPAPNPHNRAAVSCAALDACCAAAAAAHGARAAGDADGTVDYAACRARKLARLRGERLACDRAVGAGPDAVWVTAGEPLPDALLGAAQVGPPRVPSRAPPARLPSGLLSVGAVTPGMVSGKSLRPWELHSSLQPARSGCSGASLHDCSQGCSHRLAPWVW